MSIQYTPEIGRGRGPVNHFAYLKKEDQTMNYLNKIRIENPLTICYTNDVVKNFVWMVY